MAADKVIRVRREFDGLHGEVDVFVGFAIISEGREFLFPALGEAVEALRDAQANRMTYAASYDADAREIAGIQEGELRAEFGMSWVHGGGRAEDVGAAWALFGGR